MKLDATNEAVVTLFSVSRSSSPQTPRLSGKRMHLLTGTIHLAFAARESITRLTGMQCAHPPLLSQILRIFFRSTRLKPPTRRWALAIAVQVKVSSAATREMAFTSISSLFLVNNEFASSVSSASRTTGGGGAYVPQISALAIVLVAKRLSSAAGSSTTGISGRELSGYKIACSGRNNVRAESVSNPEDGILHGSHFHLASCFTILASEISKVFAPG
mmetsp:Transcript_28681/g.52444  ORF Transcript_28681/g.52444 Transcript_28681/m.52444 type:complete len:217 (+) Transcript_28681:1437-2087(+)